MEIGTKAAAAAWAAAIALLLAGTARAQGTPADVVIEVSDEPPPTDVWTRYRECEARLKPVEQDEFQRLAPERRAAFLDERCSTAPAAPTAPAAAQPARAAVARFEDRDGGIDDAEILAALDTALWTTFSGRRQERYELARLEPVASGCGRKCQVDAARAAGAALLVRGEAQWVGGEHFARIEIVSVATGAVLSSRHSAAAPEPAALVEGATRAMSAAADHLFAAAEPTAPPAPAAAGKPLVAVARLADAVPGVPDPDLAPALDDALYDAIAGAKPPRFRIGRLPPPVAPCDRACAVAAGTAAGATYIVESRLERRGGELRIVGALVSVSNGWAVVESESIWVTDPSHLRHAVGMVARDVVVVLVRAGSPAPSARAGGWSAGAAAYAADTGERRARNLGSPAYAKYRSRRNGGIACFVLGVLLEGAGGGLLGAGFVIGSVPLLVSGSIVGGVGTIMFWAGLGAWISNQIHMNKVERGTLISRLRLDGLAPIVAAGDRGAPGLSARFAF